VGVQRLRVGVGVENCKIVFLRALLQRFVTFYIRALDSGGSRGGGMRGMHPPTSTSVAYFT